MLLTGKCKEDFLIHLKETRRCNEKSFSEFPAIFEDALIIEWFIYRQIWQNVFYKEYRHTAFSDYTFAINQSIKKCNEIYNNLNKQ